MKYSIIILAALFLLSGCSGNEPQPGREYCLIETGTIDSGDLTDPDHSDLAFDAFEFQVEPLDVVTVSIDAEGFDPMVKLVEVSTGAVLAEWDSQYAQEDLLTYTIAGGGTCQARVYALEGGIGNYTVSITVTGS